MNETKPTAKAATTVVSTPPLTGRSAASSASRRRASSGSSAGPAGVRGAGGRARRQRRAVSSDERERRRAPASTGHEPGRRASKPPSSGSASTRGPYSATSASLICCLGPALRRSARRMNARSWSATAEFGDVQRRAALHAHDLVLDVGQRGAAARRPRPAAEHGEREQRGAGRGASRRLLEQRRQGLVEPLWVDRAAPHRGDRPRGRSRSVSG